QIKEISDIYQEYAPRYYSSTVGNAEMKNFYENSDAYYIMNEQDKNQIFGIPVGTSQSVNYSALLVKKEIAESYGKDIDSFNDYEDLLKWIKENRRQFKPGLVPLRNV